MITIPKPKHCLQNWLDMNHTNGGRICGQCDKKIVDFSKMSWIEIENLQRQNNNTVCGMYNQKQLDNWGQEIPTHKDSLLKVAAITGLTISLTLPTYAQTINTTDSVVIKGKIIDEKDGEGLPWAKVILKNSKVGTTTDIDGNFKLIVRSIPTLPLTDTLEVNYIGYIKKQIILKDIKEINNVENKIKLKDEKLILTTFYVTKPTLIQRIKWKLKKWFGLKSK